MCGLVGFLGGMDGSDGGDVLCVACRIRSSIVGRMTAGFDPTASSELVLGINVYPFLTYRQQTRCGSR